MQHHHDPYRDKFGRQSWSKLMIYMIHANVDIHVNKDIYIYISPSLATD
jgi:hypothetical protein